MVHIGKERFSFELLPSVRSTMKEELFFHRSGSGNSKFKTLSLEEQRARRQQYKDWTAQMEKPIRSAKGQIVYFSTKAEAEAVFEHLKLDKTLYFIQCSMPMYF